MTPLPIRALLLASALLACACTSQERLTSKQTPCGTREVKIVSSDFSRRGVTTAWCAECKGKVYQCASNVERTRAQCHVAGENDICK